MNSSLSHRISTYQQLKVLVRKRCSIDALTYLPYSPSTHCKESLYLVYSSSRVGQLPLR